MVRWFQRLPGWLKLVYVGVFWDIVATIAGILSTGATGLLVWSSINTGVFLVVGWMVWVDRRMH